MLVAKEDAVVIVNRRLDTLGEYPYGAATVGRRRWGIARLGGGLDVDELSYIMFHLTLIIYCFRPKIL